MATIKDITAQLEQVQSLADPLWEVLEEDRRSGVIKAVKKRQAVLKALEEEYERLYNMSSYERQLYAEGLTFIAGIDEVGRGPLAGPVVAAAVILPKDCQILGLNDSKKIPKSKHDSIYQKVLEEAVAVGIGIVDEKTIDEVNIYEATKLAMLDALKQLKITPDHLLIDAMHLDSSIPQTSIIKGDANSVSIAAASIVAKVTRDRLMATYDELYPAYHFAQNAGYGTKAHLLAIKEKGICPIHRRSFEPIKSLVVNQTHD